VQDVDEERIAVATTSLMMAGMMAAMTSLMAVGMTAPSRGDNDDDAASLGRPDPEVRPLPTTYAFDDGGADSVLHWTPPRARISFHTTMSSVLASSMIRCSDGNPTVGSDLSPTGIDLGSEVFFLF
jgi:hypothetical protein